MPLSCLLEEEVHFAMKGDDSLFTVKEMVISLGKSMGRGEVRITV